MKRKKNILFAKFIKTKDNEQSVMLQYSILHFLSGNYKWFCRIWNKNSIQFGESYGRTKFQAYRLAMKKLNKDTYNKERGFIITPKNL